MTANNRSFFVYAVISAIAVAIASFTFLPVAKFSDLQGVTDPAIRAYSGNPAGSRSGRC